MHCTVLTLAVLVATAAAAADYGDEGYGVPPPEGPGEAAPGGYYGDEGNFGAPEGNLGAPEGSDEAEGFESEGDNQGAAAAGADQQAEPQSAFFEFKGVYVKSAESISLCPPGQEPSSLLNVCYPNCRSGYGGEGPVCWAYCRRGYTNHGLTCYKNIISWYFKASYGRGAGKISFCGASYPRLINGRCYAPCKPGYVNFGVFCKKST
eukprot:m.272878 g.272878  ORF g.272878 m.272878 type:complete len:207 (-) comp22848_c0_seq1:56-676(-)